MCLLHFSLLLNIPFCPFSAALPSKVLAQHALNNPFIQSIKSGQYSDKKKNQLFNVDISL